MIIKARKLLNFTTDQLQGMLTGSFDIQFANGDIIHTNYREVLYFSVCMDIIREYPNTALRKEHFISTAYRNGYITSSTHTTVLNALLWDVVDTYDLNTWELKSRVIKMLYEVINEMYNKCIVWASRHVTTLSLEDFLDIQFHPKVVDVLSRVTRERRTIEDAHFTVMEVIMNDADVADNQLVKMARDGSVNRNQLLQCLAPRGFVTEVDGKILPVPVTKGFVHGLTDLYDITAESRSAAKALFHSKIPLQDAEYFARQLKLLTMSVGYVVPNTDCGSKRYMTWPNVRDAVYDSRGVMSRPSDLKHLEGKFMVVDDEGGLVMIRATDTHLIGKSIKLRSVQTCQLTEAKNICSVCYGGLAESLPNLTNVAIASSSGTTVQTTQKVLSTKHHDASSKAERVVLGTEAVDFIKVQSDTELCIAKNFTKNTKMIIPASHVPGMSDILETDYVHAINPSRVSSIPNITILDITKFGDITIPISLVSINRTPMFTTDFLKHINKYPPVTNVEGNFVFSFEEWDKKLPVFKYSETEYSFGAHSREIASVIKSGGKTKGTDVASNPMAVLSKLFDLVNSKLDVNIVLLEVIVYSATISNTRAAALTRFMDGGTVGVRTLQHTLTSRSLSAVLAYQTQSVTLLNPRSMIKGDRPDHAFDCFVDPHAVVKHYLDNKEK